MGFKETVELMLSDDYKDRFIAEYLQTKERYERLKRFNNRIEAAERVNLSGGIMKEPEHDCPSNLLREQQRVMGEYLHLLEVCGEIEGIEVIYPQ
ncbi:MAG: hypothetical protein U0L73_02510 [Ruminococcus bromii]|nr:hypothetical protein [Ruminococcus bromii]